MKVYRASFIDYDWDDLVGYFSTREKAEEALSLHNTTKAGKYQKHIEEAEIDAVTHDCKVWGCEPE